jgi:hypothetical protein
MRLTQILRFCQLVVTLIEVAQVIDLQLKYNSRERERIYDWPPVRTFHIANKSFGMPLPNWFVTSYLQAIVSRGKN